jgi:hypothetical protein
MEIFEKLLRVGNEVIGKKSDYCQIFNQEHPTDCVSLSNPGIHVEKPATNNLRHCTVWRRREN